MKYTVDYFIKKFKAIDFIITAAKTITFYIVTSALQAPIIALAAVGVGAAFELNIFISFLGAVLLRTASNLGRDLEQRTRRGRL